MDSKKIKLLTHFRTQIIKFMDELIGQFPKRSEFYFIRIFVKDQIPLEDVLGRFIKIVLPYRHIIKMKNADIIFDNDIITKGIIGVSEDQYVNENLESAQIFKDLWLADELSDDDRDVIWTWFNVFVDIAYKYYELYGSIRGWEVDVDAEVDKVHAELKIKIPSH